MDLEFLTYAKGALAAAALIGAALALSTFLFRNVRKWLRWTVFAAGLLVTLAGLTGVLLLQQAEKLTGSDRVNQVVPDFEFKLAENDQPLQLSAYRDKVILLNFWATWCSPCREEMPYLEQLHHKYKDRGLVVLTISDEDGPTVREFLAEHELSMPSGYLDVEGGNQLPALFRNIVGRPTTFVIGRDGEVKKVIVGASSFETFEKAISNYL